MWTEILNKSFEDNNIKKNKLLGFFLVKLEYLIFKHVPTKKKEKQKRRRVAKRKRKRQLVGCLNKFCFSYAGRDVVNQAGKVAPGIIKSATNNINNIEE